VIDSYELLFKKADDTFTEDLLNCDGSDNIILNALTCSIPMLELGALTGLPTDTLIKVKLRAHNDQGWGIYSEVNSIGQVIETLPLTIAPVTIDQNEVLNDQIRFRWSDAMASQTGGAAVLIQSYVVEFSYDGGLTYEELPSIPYGTNDYLHIGLTGGLTYQYRIKAVNKYGRALEFSVDASMLAGQAPD
jgi:hypothetical protein